ncbi:TPA: hypothetical protein HA338_16610 [Methanosarcina acetivorans]|uniref:Proteinase inhibitor I42 chagasin domain-containing protein n=1 Tax=Methanosarcina acetivorans TaxID=2214 RepID=A0A832W8J1_9EURY|nr:hypothetical protein [Methanosarcina acetivorans]
MNDGLNLLRDKYHPWESEGGDTIFGAGGFHLWKIEATSTGSHSMETTYKRPWEESGVRTFTHNIEVIRVVYLFYTFLFLTSCKLDFVQD